MKFHRMDLTTDGTWVIGFMTEFPPDEECIKQLQFDNDVGNVLRWCKEHVKLGYIPMTQRNSVRIPQMQADDCTFIEYEQQKMLIMQVRFFDKKEAKLFQKHWC